MTNFDKLTIQRGHDVVSDSGIILSVNISIHELIGKHHLI